MLNDESDKINQAAFLAQIAIQPRRVKAAAEDVVAELQRVVIGVCPGERQGFRQRHLVLHAAGIRHMRDGPRHLSGRAETACWAFAAGFPIAEIFFDYGHSLIRRDIADTTIVVNIRAKRAGEIIFHVVQRERLDGGRSGFARGLEAQDLAGAAHPLARRGWRPPRPDLKAAAAASSISAVASPPRVRSLPRQWTSRPAARSAGTGRRAARSRSLSVLSKPRPSRAAMIGHPVAADVAAEDDGVARPHARGRRRRRPSRSRRRRRW